MGQKEKLIKKSNSCPKTSLLKKQKLFLDISHITVATRVKPVAPVSYSLVKNIVQKYCSISHIPEKNCFSIS